MMKSSAKTLASAAFQNLIVHRLCSARWWRFQWLKILRCFKLPYTDKYGVRIRLRPEDNVTVLASTQLHFDDESVIRLATRLLKPGMTVFDVGANIGLFAVYAAKVVGPQGRVHCFEPTTETCRRLRENAGAIRGSHAPVQINQCAIGSVRGTMNLYIYPAGCAAWNSFFPHRMGTEGETILPLGTEQVPVITLDDYVDKQRVDRIDLLKIDVEGFEIEALQGTRRLLQARRIGFIIFEISTHCLEGTGRKGIDVLREVAALGLDIQQINSDGNLQAVNIANSEVPHFVNYLAQVRVSAN